jgi:hypothetical protein
MERNFHSKNWFVTLIKMVRGEQLNCSNKLEQQHPVQTWCKEYTRHLLLSLSSQGASMLIICEVDSELGFEFLFQPTNF